MKVSTVSILVVLMLMVSLVGAKSVTAEQSNVAGTVTMSKSYISATGTLTVTLTDADLNIGVAQTNEASDYAAVNYATPATFVQGTQFNLRVKKYPILDNNADGYVNFQDVTSSIAGAIPFSVQASSGIVTMIGTATAVNAATAFTVSYKAADIQTADLTVSSGQDATGFTLRLLETSATSGVFSETFVIGAATVNTSAGNETSLSADLNGDGDALDTAVARGLCATTHAACNVRPVIAAVAGSLLSAAYTDALPAGTITGSSTVESTVPLFALTEPTTGTSTQNPQVRLIATVTDGDSLVDSTTIKMWIKRGTANATEHTPTITAITSGHKAEFILTSVTTGETDIQWWLKASDKAGNVGITETNTTTACTVGSFSASATGGCDGYTVRVDTVAPAFDSSSAANNVTGVWWDSTKTTTDKTNSLVTAAKKDQVIVMFGENVDSATVAPSDFSITLGTVVTTPTAAVVHAGAPKTVFLTLGTALTAAQKPTIKVVGSVSDKAGNSTTSGSVATSDGIAPTITVTAGALSKTSVTISVISDETLASTPTISVANQSNATTGAVGSYTAHANASLVGTNSWTLTFATTTQPTGNNVKNITITGTDLAGNAGTAGKAATITAGAVTFQIDTTLPAPTILPTGNTEQTSPFVSMDFSGEGTEYVGDSSKTVTITAATLTPTGGTAVDILGSLSTNDSITYIYAATALAKGVYTVKVSATDVATNVVTDSTGTFTVIAPAAYSISLTPGWNLISLPREAAASAIDTVIASTHPVDQIITYDPSSDALFLLSSRTGSDAFAGSLTNIVSTKAYWVHTSSFQALKVTLSEVTPQNTVPAAISVVKGWNMLPVMSLLSTPPATIDADVYLSTIRWSKAYSWNATSRTFAGFTPGGADTVATGSGYWVYADLAGTLIP